MRGAARGASRGVASRRHQTPRNQQCETADRAHAAEMRLWSLLLLVLAFVSAVVSEEAPGAESYKVNNILKRKDLGNPSREEVVAALLEADGNAGKAAV